MAKFPKDLESRHGNEESNFNAKLHEDGENVHCVLRYHNYLGQCLSRGHFICFWYFASRNNTAMNILEQMPFCSHMKVSAGQIPWSATAKSKGECILNLYRYISELLPRKV